MKKILLILIISLPLNSLAQNYRIELILKGGHLSIFRGSGPDFNLESTYGLPDYIPIPTGEMYYFIRPKIGIGVFYTNSIHSYVGYTNGNHFDLTSGRDHYLEGNPSYQHYGMALQFSTNREKRFRLYAKAGILKAEQVIDFGGFITAKNGVAYSGGIGLIIKFTRTISFNVFDARYILYNKDFGYAISESPFGIQVDTGFIFKIIRKK